MGKIDRVESIKAAQIQVEFSRGQSKLVCCTRDDCGGFDIVDRQKWECPDDRKFYFNCPNKLSSMKGRAHCFRCGLEDHSNKTNSCSDYKIILKEQDAEQGRMQTFTERMKSKWVNRKNRTLTEEQNEKLLAALLRSDPNMVQCPKCRKYMERNGGCLHMICGRAVGQRVIEVGEDGTERAVFNAYQTGNGISAGQGCGHQFFSCCLHPYTAGSNGGRDKPCPHAPWCKVTEGSKDARYPMRGNTRYWTEYGVTSEGHDPDTVAMLQRAQKRSGRV